MCFFWGGSFVFAEKNTNIGVFFGGSFFFANNKKRRSVFLGKETWMEVEDQAMRPLAAVTPEDPVGRLKKPFRKIT